MNGLTIEETAPAGEPTRSSWRPVRYFLCTERDHAERYATRLRAKEDGCVRVVPCAGRGLRVDVGEDERRVAIPVERERRQAA